MKNCHNCKYMTQEKRTQFKCSCDDIDWVNEEHLGEECTDWKQKEPTVEKPPLGVVPKHIFEELRIKELCRALNEYAQFGNKKELMLEWTLELCERLEANKNGN